MKQKTVSKKMKQQGIPWKGTRYSDSV